MESELESVKALIHEHQRQITQLFELYERTKQHNDHRSYLLNQGLEHMSGQLISLQKEARATFRAFDHLHLAVKQMGFREVCHELKSLHKEVSEMKKLQTKTNEDIARQNVYVKELEQVLRRTYILSDNAVNLGCSMSDSNDALQEIFQRYEQHIFPLGTPVPTSDTHPPISPLSLPEKMV